MISSCFLRRGGLLVLTWIILVPMVQGQRNPSGLPRPRLYQVSPTGAKVGTTVEIVVAGKHLDDPQKLVFSHPGIKAEYLPPPTPEIDPKTKQPKPIPGALPAEHFKFRVQVAADVPLGNHDVRVVNKWGVSNPRVFVVGDLQEVEEKEPNNDVDQAQKVERNATVNGTIAHPGDVDYFRCAVSKGQRVVVSCLASSIDSRLHPQVEIYDAKDRLVASNRNYATYDAVTDFVAREEGEYTIRLFQFTHTFQGPIPGNMPAGASDYFYRLSISTAPWIDAVVPAVVEPGKATTVTVYGRNLPGGKLDPSAVIEEGALEKLTTTVTAPADSKGKLRFSGSIGPASGWMEGFELRLRNETGSSNGYLLGIAHAPVVLDNGDNETPEKAQEVTLPCEIAGSVEKRRDRDWYAFHAKKGETWNLEVFSHRLGAPTYMMFLLRNAQSKGEIYESPLNENLNRYSRKFFSRSEDPPVYRFTAPADGKYQLLVGSRAGDTLYGPRHVYAVRITREEPDFQLMALSAEEDTPDTPCVPKTGNDAYTVIVDRSETFRGDIELTVEGLPAGVSCPPQILHGSVQKTTLVLTATPEAPAWSGEVKIKGTALINGNKVVREARAAGIVWPTPPNQNIPTMSRLERSQWLAVGEEKAGFTLMPEIDKAEIAQGDKATLKIKVQRNWPDLKAPMQVMLMQLQNRQGSEIAQNLRINNNQVNNINPDQKEIALPVTVGNDVPPGVYNLVFRGQTTVALMMGAKRKQGGRQPTIVAYASAPLAVTVLPKNLAQLSLASNSATLKVGGQTEVTVRVQRQWNYQGEFKVQLVLPAGVSGIQAGEVTIPAGQNEVKLLLRADPGAAPGGRNNLVIKATGLYNGKSPVVQETKLNVNVVK